MQIGPEDDKGISWEYTGPSTKSDERVLKARPRELVPEHRRSANKLNALPLVEQDVAMPQFVNFRFRRGEVHSQYISDVDAIFEDVGNPKVWTHVRARVVLW